MTKDLFAVLFKTFSKWSYEEYYANFIERLPYRFIQGASGANPDLDSCSGLTELRELFARERGQRWNNAELYPHLNRVIIPGYSFLQRHIDALRVHVGLQSLTPSIVPGLRLWRLRDPILKVVEIAESNVKDKNGFEVPVTLGQPFPIVYRPHPGLFDDIERHLYRGNGCDIDSFRLSQLVENAFNLVAEYSPDIASGFRQAINTVAMMTRQPGGTKSFSLRNFYIGGIFVSIGDPIMLAEQFIHEYYHQCIWPWWMVEPPPDLPRNEKTIVSPITGRVRPVSVMIQALLIYQSLIDFYRFVLSDPECRARDQGVLTDAQTRLSKIEDGSEPLLAALDSALAGHPRTRAMVEMIVGTCAV